MGTYSDPPAWRLASYRYLQDESISYKWLPHDSPTEGDLSAALILFMGPWILRDEQNEIVLPELSPINDYLKSIP